MSVASGSMEPSDPRVELTAVRKLVARGELLEAYDRARSCGDAAPDGPERTEALYLAALALARSGAIEQASVLAEAAIDDAGPALPERLAEDLASLEARIAKDRARTAAPSDQGRLYRDAAQLYERAHDRFGGSYPCINAATTWLLAGDAARSRSLARRARSLVGEATDYWGFATLAEASVLLGDLDDVVDALAAAADLSPGEWATRASTRRQMEALCAALGLDPQMLEVLANPRVVHFAGHRLDPLDATTRRFPAEEEARVAAEVAEVLRARRMGIGFGSLASGADIIIAEQLAAAGGEVHVVLPFAAEEFIATSVADAGPRWVERFTRRVEEATSVRLASDGQFLGDPAMFDFGSQVAMGEAVNRAAALATEAEQLAVWDGRPAGPDDVTGTAVDVARWRSLQHRCTVIRPDHGVPAAGAGTAGAGAGGPLEAHHEWGAGNDRRAPLRTVRAMLFADLAGFSKLGDLELPTFMSEVMAPLADVIDRFADRVLIRHTWGDGIYLVFSTVEASAHCALEMQAAMAALELERNGLGALRGMRVGIHVGPVFEGTDPISGQTSIYGANVTRAARIEPRTPEGQVYVTDHVAALAALGGNRDFACDYVGRLPAAKDYGILPMYALTLRSR